MGKRESGYVATGQGHTCPKCGVWVDSGRYHVCYIYEQQPAIMTIDERMANALERIADALEKIAGRVG